MSIGFGVDPLSPKTAHSVSGPEKAPIVTTLVEPLYLNKKQLARALPVSERTIDNWKERRLIHYHRVWNFKLKRWRKANGGALETRPDRNRMSALR